MWLRAAYNAFLVVRQCSSVRFRCPVSARHTGRLERIRELDYGPGSSARALKNGAGASSSQEVSLHTDGTLFVSCSVTSTTFTQAPLPECSVCPWLA